MLSWSRIGKILQRYFTYTNSDETYCILCREKIAPRSRHPLAAIYGHFKEKHREIIAMLRDRIETRQMSDEEAALSVLRLLGLDEEYRERQRRSLERDPDWIIARTLFSFLSMALREARGNVVYIKIQRITKQLTTLLNGSRMNERQIAAKLSRMLSSLSWCGLIRRVERSPRDKVYFIERGTDMWNMLLERPEELARLYYWAKRTERIRELPQIISRISRLKTEKTR